MDDLQAMLSEYDLLSAFWMTIRIALVSALGSLVIGTIVAVLRVAPVGMLRGFGAAYVNIIRNTPLTLIVFFCAFGLMNNLRWSVVPADSPTSIADNNFWFGCLGLSMYTAAFVAESLRSGVNTVPVGQAEAARAVGLSFMPALVHVILPQAFRGAIAPLGNTLIALTKNTTVLATIGVAEASYQMSGMLDSYGSLLLVIFAVIAFGFVVLTLPTGFFFTWLSRRLAVQR